ncbi:chitin deacetylase [Chytridiales sp. JEL 0842]|nr:chitin deacetylase [Chytridiales sp. JEL 0842]
MVFVYPVAVLSTTLLLALSPAWVGVDAQVLAGYPPSLQITPRNAEWSRKYLGGANIPNIPVNEVGGLGSDWNPDIQHCLDPKSWAMTYDDGPGPYTPALLDDLRAANVKATFFLIGSTIQASQANVNLVKRMFDEGHQIGIHTWSHNFLTTLTNDQIVSEVMWTGKIIEEITGVFPRYVRPPTGDIDERVRAVLRHMGMQVAIWNRDPGDWALSTMPNARNVTPDSIIADFNQWLQYPPTDHGFLTLQHDVSPFAAEAARATLKLVLDRGGYNLMTVAECLRDSTPYFVGEPPRLEGLPATWTEEAVPEPTTQTTKVTGGVPNAVVGGTATPTKTAGSSGDVKSGASEGRMAMNIAVTIFSSMITLGVTIGYLIS